MTSLRALCLAALALAACGRDPLDLPEVSDGSPSTPNAGSSAGKGGSSGTSAGRDAGSAATGGTRDASMSPARPDGAPVPPSPTLAIVPEAATVPLGYPVKYAALEGVDRRDVSAQATWTLSDASAGTLTPDGTFTAKRAGAFTMTATTAAGGKASSKVTVVVAVPLDVLVNPGQTSATVGGTRRFSATVRYSEGSQTDATEFAVWSVRDAAVATIANQAGQRGLATGKQAGSTAVVARAFDVAEGQAQLRVEGSVTTTALALTPTSPSRQIGTSVAFSALATTGGRVEDATASARWSSSNSAVASLQSHTATCRGAGTSTITATYNGVTASTRLTCTQATSRVLAILVKPSELTVVSGAAYKLSAEATYADRGTRDVTGSAVWASSDESVVKVAGGALTVLKAGTATITAELDGVRGAAAVTALR